MVEPNTVLEYVAWEREFVASEFALNQALTRLCSNLVAYDHSIEQMALDVLDHARALTGSAHGCVSEIDPRTHEIVGYSSTEIDGSYPALRSAAFNRTRSFFANDLGDKVVTTPPGHMVIDRLLAVPVLFHGELLGQIALANSHRCYRPDDLDTVEQLAELFAIALHRKRETERMAALEAHLRQAQKLDALGQLTGGVAHDFNNLLSVIAGNLDLLQDETTTEALRQELLDDALQAVASGAALTARLLAFARRQPLSVTPADVNVLIEQVEHLLRRTLSPRVVVACHCPPQLWTVRVDANQIEHAVLNLALNARDAMPDGGTLRITAENLLLDGPGRDGAGRDRFPGIAAGAYVVIAVTDTGAGMPPAVRERALEPFFTTKAAGKGTGLGLSTVYGIVRQLGGDLHIDSVEGHGTTVSLFLPRLEEEVVVSGHEAARSR